MTTEYVNHSQHDQESSRNILSTFDIVRDDENTVEKITSFTAEQDKLMRMRDINFLVETQSRDTYPVVTGSRAVDMVFSDPRHPGQTNYLRILDDGSVCGYFIVENKQAGAAVNIAQRRTPDQLEIGLPAGAKFTMAITSELTGHLGDYKKAPTPDRPKSKLTPDQEEQIALLDYMRDMTRNVPVENGKGKSRPLNLTNVLGRILPSFNK